MTLAPDIRLVRQETTMNENKAENYTWSPGGEGGKSRVAFDLMRTVLERNYEYYRNPDEILALYCRCANTVSLPEAGPAEAFRVETARTLRSIRKVS